jgi:hypothetical protein
MPTNSRSSGYVCRKITAPSTNTATGNAA